MESFNQPIQNSRYSLQSAAKRLHIHPATLRFWEECFHEELATAKDDDGEPMFSNDDLQSIRQIERIVLGEGRTVEEARTAVFSKPGNGMTNPEVTSTSHSWEEEMNEMKASVSALSDQISLLLDESRSLQHLFTRLVDMVEHHFTSDTPEQIDEAEYVTRTPAGDSNGYGSSEESDLFSELRRLESAELNGHSSAPADN